MVHQGYLRLEGAFAAARRKVRREVFRLKRRIGDMRPHRACGQAVRFVPAPRLSGTDPDHLLDQLQALEPITIVVPFFNAYEAVS